MNPARLAVPVLALVALSGCGGKSTGRIHGLFEESVGPEATELEVAMRTCDAEHQILSVDQSGSDTIIITIESTAGSDDDCGQSIYITLSDPLGDRIVLDGHTNEPMRILPP